MNYHRGLRFQSGGAGKGIGSIFSSIFRSLKPIAQMGLSAGKKFLKSDFAKKVGSTALDLGKSALTNVAADLLEGKAFKETAQENLDEAKSKIAQTLRGGGKKRKRISKNKNNKNVKYNLLK